MKNVIVEKQYIRKFQKERENAEVIRETKHPPKNKD